MPRLYKDAKLLEDKILAVSGKFFKMYGYTDTTFQMIADELHIHPTSIAHHFKSKANLLFCLFVNDMTLIYGFVCENMSGNINKFKIHCAAHFYFYKEILRNERNRDLFFNKHHRKVLIDEQLFIVKNYFKEIMEDFRKDFDEDELSLIAVMSLGAKLSTVIELSKHPELFSVDKVCYQMAYMVGTLAKLDEATIKKNIQDALDFVNTRPGPQIYFAD